MKDCFRNEGPAITIPVEDLRVLVNSALRYAIPRQSYITGLTADILKALPDEVWDYRCLSVALTDLKAYLNEWDAGYKPNMDCDNQIWQSLYNYLEKKNNKGGK